MQPEDVLEPSASSFTDDDFINRINARIKAQAEALHPTFFGRILQRLDNSIERRAYDLLMRRIATTPDPGRKLIAFLNEEVEPNARLAVTGHSKGGALAPATALWLAENWSAARETAEISCFSFAGPTPGNSNFAQRYNERLGARTRRIVNIMDVVPHAWVPAQLLGMREFYPQLAPALTDVASSIADPGYAHVGNELIEFKGAAAPSSNLLAKIIHHHLDAYLLEARFGSDWTATKIFLT